LGNHLGDAINHGRIAGATLQGQGRDVDLRARPRVRGEIPRK